MIGKFTPRKNSFNHTFMPSSSSSRWRSSEGRRRLWGSRWPGTRRQCWRLQPWKLTWGVFEVCFWDHVWHCFCLWGFHCPEKSSLSLWCSSIDPWAKAEAARHWFLLAWYNLKVESFLLCRLWWKPYRQCPCSLWIPIVQVASVRHQFGQHCWKVSNNSDF